MQVMDSPTTQLNIFASAQKNAHLKIRFSHSQVTASSQRSLHYSFSLQLNKTLLVTSIKLLRLYNWIYFLSYRQHSNRPKVNKTRMMHYRLVPWMASKVIFDSFEVMWIILDQFCRTEKTIGDDYWVVMRCR